MKTYGIALLLLLSPIVDARAIDAKAVEADTPPAVTEKDDDATQLVQDVFQTELVYPQDKGETQLTIAPTWVEARDGRSKTLPVLVEYGLTNAWQVGVTFDAFQDVSSEDGESAHGSGDLELGTKYSFMNIGGSAFHAAIGVDLSLPTGNPDRGLGEGLLAVEPYVAVGRDLPEWNNAHVFGQVGLSLVRRERGESDGEGTPAHELSVNTGLIYPINNARLVGELNWASNRWNHDGDETSLFVTPGVIWDLPGTWEIGVGVPIGLTDDGDRYRVIGQLTWEFGGD